MSPDTEHTAWVNIEVSLDIDGHLTEYSIKGRPDCRRRIEFIPEFEDGDADIQSLHGLQAILVNLDLRLVDCTYSVTTDEVQEKFRGLKIVEPAEDEDEADRA